MAKVSFNKLVSFNINNILKLRIQRIKELPLPMLSLDLYLKKKRKEKTLCVKTSNVLAISTEI